MTAIYDHIGKTYDTTRRADPGIVQQVVKFLDLKPQGRCLDVGCGSGNYTYALQQAGLGVDGVDISAEMLNKAKTKYPSVQWHQASVTALPFADNTFDGVTCVLASHHFPDVMQAFQEMFRVLNTGKIVLFTSTPEQMAYYCLAHYFPKMLAAGAAKMLSFPYLEKALVAAGFAHVHSQPFFIDEGLVDGFLGIGKHRPEIYLDEQVRAGMSIFQLYAEPNELQMGLSQLQQDLTSGAITEIIQQYDAAVGDYLYVVAEKQ